MNELEKMRIKNLRYTNTMLTFTAVLSMTTLVGSILFDSNTVEAHELVFVEAEKIEVDNEVNYHDSEYLQQIETLFEEDDLVNNTDGYVCEYSGMKISNELEDEVKRLADIYGIDYRIVLTIGERESGGNWNNNGVISPSNDYGAFQINECNLGYIKDNLGYSKEEILYDSTKNAEACMFLLKDIINREDVKTIEDVFGMYNGWVGWENKPLAVSYSSGCLEIMDNYFPDFEYKKNNGYNNL